MPIFYSGLNHGRDPAGKTPFGDRECWLTAENTVVIFDLLGTPASEVRLQDPSRFVPATHLRRALLIEAADDADAVLQWIGTQTGFRAVQGNPAVPEVTFRSTSRTSSSDQRLQSLSPFRWYLGHSRSMNILSGAFPSPPNACSTPRFFFTSTLE